MDALKTRSIFDRIRGNAIMAGETVADTFKGVADYGFYKACRAVEHVKSEHTLRKEYAAFAAKMKGK